MKPRLLDLCCGAGGATKGYQRAGFYVVGVDIKPQPRYCGDEFVRMDWLDYMTTQPGGGGERWFDAVHASPPCQFATRARKIQGNKHPNHVPVVRAILQHYGAPWVIENVVGAPLVNPTLLCGTMFGLRVYRHRLFEASFSLPFTLHPAHHRPQVKMGRPVQEGDVIQPVGNFSGVEYARRAMDTPWMNQQDMREAIPPAYTEWIGRELMRVIQVAA